MKQMLNSSRRAIKPTPKSPAPSQSAAVPPPGPRPAFMTLAAMTQTALPSEQAALPPTLHDDLDQE